MIGSRRWVLVPSALAALLALGVSPPENATPAPCRIVAAVLDDDLDSGSAREDEPFQFVVAAGPLTGARGFGVVSFVRGARRGGGAGQLGLEARFVENPDGSHTPAAIVAVDGRAAAVTDGRTRNAPMVLGALGLIHSTPYEIAAGLAGAYGALHFGGQARLAKGTPLEIVLGDAYAEGACTLPASGPGAGRRR